MKLKDFTTKDLEEFGFEYQQYDDEFPDEGGFWVLRGKYGAIYWDQGKFSADVTLEFADLKDKWELKLFMDIINFNNEEEKSKN